MLIAQSLEKTGFLLSTQHSELRTQHLAIHLGNAPANLSVLRAMPSAKLR
ncbi:MAG: hypothetical protein RMY16_06260 [Nostoc sp. DedQUE12b]|nr:hypothetical protein [Nostoc sp. DedQUE12b]MDZ8085188.1 hypothetical protein [Nostoc sp. DedQUE12b]